MEDFTTILDNQIKYTLNITILFTCTGNNLVKTPQFFYTGRQSF